MTFKTSNENENSEYRFKIILAGDGAVGKTTLINRFVTGKFKTDYKATIGVEITTKRFVIENHPINLQIWDIAGQTLFRTFRSKFYSNAKGALLVFDLTVSNSLDSLHTWIEDIEQVTGKIPYILIGNKADLTDICSITPYEVARFQELQKIGNFFNTSALTGENVEHAFSELANLMI
ncbi:MAG: Rab family GTPase [Candidatus Hodarchaeota archaeon]